MSDVVVGGGVHFQHIERPQPELLPLPAGAEDPDSQIPQPLSSPQLLWHPACCGSPLLPHIDVFKEDPPFNFQVHQVTCCLVSESCPTLL